MNEIRIFQNEQFGEIRTAGTVDEPLFCLSDVCKCVGIANARNVKLRLDEEDVRLVDTPTNGGIQQLSFVTESGLYDVIIRSDSVAAKPFRKWITSEVLPSIRKTGLYAAKSISRKELAMMVIKAEEENEKLMLENQQQQTVINEMTNEIERMKPKVSYYDLILNNKSTVTITQIAQDYDISAKAMNKILSNKRIQRKVGGQWILYANYLSNGYVQSKPIDIIHSDGSKSVKYNTEWTQKGRIFLYEQLKKGGLLPLIELK